MKISKEMFTINRGVVLIKAIIFLQSFGTRMMLPFLTLHMRTLGLTFDDIGLIYGTIPFVVIMSGPVSGLLGEKVGYRPVLIVNVLLIAASSACFDFTPRYHEYTRIPTATIYRENTNSSTYKLASIQWPLCDQNVTISNCEASQPFLNSFENITSYLSCQANNGFQYDDDFLVLPPNVTENVNGSYCFANIDHDNNNNSNYQVCNIIGYSEMPTCKETEGKHSTTVWVYFALRMVFSWCMNSAFAITNATSLRLANLHNSHFSKIQRFALLAQLISPFVSGAVIKDAAEGSGEETDYSLAIYIGDGFLLAAALLATRLNVVLEKSGQKTRKSLKTLFSVTTLNFFGLVFLMGFQFGIRDTFLFVYLDEEMGASSKLLSYMLAVGAGCGLLATIFSQKVIQKLGNINVMAIAFWIEAARFFIYAYVERNPPYYGIALHALDVLTMSIPWAAVMTYGYKIAPPDLIALMAATVSVVHFVLGKGIAGLVGGLILGEGTNWETPELFQATAIFCISCSTILVLVYHLVLKNNQEKVMIEKKAALLAKMKEAKEAKEAIEDKSTSEDSEEKRDGEQQTVNAVSIDDQEIKVLDKSIEEVTGKNS